MIPALGMVILPQNPSTGNGRFQAGVAFLAWIERIYLKHSKNTFGRSLADNACGVRRSYHNWHDAAFPMYILNYASVAVTSRLLV